VHVNPAIRPRALAMVYNPTDRRIAKTLSLPLYYAGLTDRAIIRERDGTAKPFDLDRACNAYVPVTMAPRSITWLVAE